MQSVTQAILTEMMDMATLTVDTNILMVDTDMLILDMLICTSAPTGTQGIMIQIIIIEILIAGAMNHKDICRK